VLSTGRAERLRIELSDQTVVWLNHSSRLELVKQ
jgi:ferric-dicitrate binding protein FerR (iron transport regulator)